MTTQPKDLMTLEETMEILALKAARIRLAEKFQGWLHSESEKEVQALELALHHLEAGRKECQCDTFKYACEFWKDSTGVTKLSYGNPSVSFCPWCGGKVPTAQEVKG